MQKPGKSSFAASIALLSPEERLNRIATLSDEEATSLIWEWPIWARADQLAPPGDWFTWLLLAGRGFGKSRCGAEWVRQRVEGDTPLTSPKSGVRSIALVAESFDEARKVMVEGEAEGDEPSGILPCSPPGFRPKYESSNRRLIWPNGAQAWLFSSTDPEGLRGPNRDLAWCDELAKWKYPRETWDNLNMVLRLPPDPRCCVTTTPRPIPLLREIVADPDTVITKGTTADNLANLAPSFYKRVLRKYGGTRLGRQELSGELLDDVPGALWQRDRLDELRRRSSELPAMRRKVVAIDPAASTGENSDETGIIVAGQGQDDHFYVLEDLSGHYTPDGWGRKAVQAYRDHKCDRIVAEVNNGGDMVEHVVRTVDRRVPYKAVHASRGKVMRAEPVAALSEQGVAHNVGFFAELEDQMCIFTPDFDRRQAGFSPDRLDAMVWAATELMLGPGAEWTTIKLVGH